MNQTTNQQTPNNDSSSYLQSQLRYMGFGEFKDALQQQLDAGATAFSLTGPAQINGDTVNATLKYEKYEHAEHGERPFLKEYELEVTKKEEPDLPVRQKFYVDNRTNNSELGNANNFTLIEAYNLLCGRSVYNSFTKKLTDEQREAQKMGEKPKLEVYKAWTRLNFGDPDDNGNYRQIKNMRFKLDDKLEELHRRFPIIEMKEAGLKSDLIWSLKKGNVTQITARGEDQKSITFYLEANAAMGNLKLYDSNKANITVNDAIAKLKNQSEEKSQEQGQEQSNKLNKKNDEEDAGEKKERTGRRARIH